jgi:valyl-tRNA synthetase
MDMDKAYSPQKHEDEIYKNWEEKGLFNPDVVGSNSKESYSIVLPPPNVTGTLHLGHASMLAIEDLMVRYNRMKGLDTLWVPGTDHAAIATQNVVEKKLYKEEQKTRHDFGREEFLSKVEEYVTQSKDTIHKQLRKMGSSLDWSREAYTLDDVRSKSVRKVFTEMFNDGLIFQGYRIVNWCPRCHSTLADDEIEHKDTKSKFYWIKYGPFVLATTRPETKLGDTAVAVHPSDERYKGMVGKKYMIPGVLGDFEITVVADEAVDPEFGSGAVKVTPGHSIVDYEIAQRHGVPIKKIIDEDGCMMHNCGKYAGMTTLEAREAIVQDMEKLNLIDRVEEDYENKLAVCYRCKSTVEPLPSDQWFIDVDKKIVKKDNKYFKKGASLKEVALKVVKDKEIEIIPDRFNKIYFNWMENLHNWCISRQIWFGHRIPVWYKKQPELKILASRHGQSNGNRDNRLNSDVKNTNNPLTNAGQADIAGDAKRLKELGFDMIISSDLQRTRETAEIFAKEWGMEVQFDERLREVGVGEFEGKPDEEFAEFRLNNFDKWHHDSPHGIESFDSLKGRVFEFLDEIKQKYPDKKVFVVTHGDVLRSMQGYNKDYTDEEIYNLTYPKTGEQIWIDLTEKPEVYVGEVAPTGDGWEQDEDTLDTWFSSGLWTFTTLLPDDWDGKEFKSSDIAKYHSTSVLETGYDIIFFWVARMILMTTYVMGEVPFEKVYLHGLIRDKDGDKMSKSKPETAIDPVEAGAKYGFDAVRLSVLIGNTAGNDVRLYDEKIEGYRNFVNKLWNISRYILMSVKSVDIPDEVKPKTLSDKWILSRFNTLKKEVTENLESYNLSVAGDKLKDFTWNELADWYLEIAKAEGDKNELLLFILKDLLKMWHPFVPFVTEAIWGNLNQEKELIISDWPEVDKKLFDAKAEKQFGLIKGVIGKIRNLRAEYKVEPAKLIKAQFVKKDKLIEQEQEVIKSMARLSDIEFEVEKSEKSAVGVVEGVELCLPLSDLVDLSKEKDRLFKEKENLEKYITGVDKKLSNKGFVDNAPEEVIKIEQGKLAEAKDKLEKINSNLKDLN